MDRSSASYVTATEVDRLAVLGSFGILDTGAEREFDDLTGLAATALGVGSAAVSLIDDTRQWFKSRHGIPFSETPREIAFCTHAVASREMLVVLDASHDPRFRDNPLVTQDGGIRFYAGAPLILRSGHCLGTLCVFDPVPRTALTDVQEAVLRDLARMVTELIESRRSREMGEIAQRIVDATTDAVLAANADGMIVYWNSAAERLFGRSGDEVIGRPVESIAPPRVAAAYRALLTRAAALEAKAISDGFIELVGMRADGSEFPLELSLARWGDRPSEGGVATVVRDITNRKTLEREREQAQAFLDTVVTNLPTMLFVKDAATRQYLMVNRRGEAVIGRPAHELIGHTDRELFPEHGEAYEDRDSEAIASPLPTLFESEFVRDDGQSVHLRTTRALVDGPDHARQYILGISEDVSATRFAEAEVLRFAQYDALTGLLNRASFIARLSELVGQGAPIALLSIDLNRFKAVNEQLGYLAGDAVLAQVGERLRAAISSQGWAARIGSDEFVATLTGPRLRERANHVALAILASIAEPFTAGHAVAYAGASIGIAMMPEDGRTAGELRERAELALHRAKQMETGSACFYNAEMDAAAQARRNLEKDLRDAVEREAIELAYQPVVSADTGQITSAEALARWSLPERGPVRPDIFIPLAEECGLIDRLGEQLLHRACHDAQHWPSEIRVAVNLSPMQFLSGKLVDTVRHAIAASGILPGRLQLEVTEGLVIRNVERTFQQLEELRALGIQILIDDFGVGYSSLSYFQRFRFDKVKIDKSFVDEITTSRSSRAIVQAVVGLGEALDIGIVAEGVETEDQRRVLVDIGCTHLQGYLFSRPVSSRCLEDMLQSQIVGDRIAL